MVTVPAAVTVEHADEPEEAGVGEVADPGGEERAAEAHERREGDERRRSATAVRRTLGRVPKTMPMKVAPR